ncbi:GAF domain-containing protein [Nocardia alni]|uniref:GAF domain-containing protein n=1 Tax=Nocardia alni TaxID=2815723 RepID=UPI001C234224|nr:GAF domain-containing protein [Nocardia alni]
MPRRVTPCASERAVRRPSGGWVVAETLDIESTPTVILDGRYLRRFANLTRASIATTAAEARRLAPLVQRCAANQRPEHDQLQLPSGSVVRIAATPIFGPAEHVYGVSVWAGPASDIAPIAPTVGAIQWDAATLLATISPAMRTLLAIPDTEFQSPMTFPTLLAQFDRWDDRAGLLSLLDPSHSVDHWTGTATTQFPHGGRQHLHIVAKAVPATSTIRALVCDISRTATPPAADSISAALRRAPIAPGHALAIVDLTTGLIHEWIGGGPFANWRNQTPHIHPEDSPLITDTCARLRAGALTVTITARIRFNDSDSWIPLQTTWTLLTHDDRPQALVDVVRLPVVTRESEKEPRGADT